MTGDLGQSIVFFGCLIVAIILHEISHGVVALWFGDDTAKRAGRLTLNPIPHVDPFGSIVLPAMGALTGIPVIGWAKPVPVNPNRLRNPRRDMLYVSFAGPATNFLLMALAALAARAVFDPSSVPFNFGLSDLPLTEQILFSFALVNLFLGLFNLLPIPPLDGSAVLERALPSEWLPRWYAIRPYGLLLLFVLVFSTGLVGDFLRPFENELINFVFP
ncbi:MAG TPA: site-2 protease family protein [Acidimicrobiia bacterium]